MCHNCGEYGYSVKRCGKAKVCRLCANEGHGKEKAARQKRSIRAIIAEDVTVREARSVAIKLDKCIDNTASVESNI